MVIILGGAMKVWRIMAILEAQTRGPRDVGTLVRYRQTTHQNQPRIHFQCLSRAMSTVSSFLKWS